MRVAFLQRLESELKHTGQAAIPDRPQATISSCGWIAIHSRRTVAPGFRCTRVAFGNHPCRDESKILGSTFRWSAPVSTYDGSPIFSTRGASRFLGLHAEKLMKWRQPDQGPDYIQSGTGGPVRYKLDALVALREINKVVVGAKP